MKYILTILLFTQLPQQNAVKPARLFCTVESASSLRCDLDSVRVAAVNGELPIGWYDDEDKPFVVHVGSSWRPLIRELRGQTPFAVEVGDDGRLWLAGVVGPKLSKTKGEVDGQPE